MALGQKVENKSLVADDGFKQIGLTLKSARRSQELSVKDVSEKLRISVDYLTKLEAGKLDELPAPAYVTGFLRSYGRCVGLDPDTLVARYMALTEGKVSTPSYKTPMNTSPPQRSAPAVASILVLSAGLAYGGWFWLKTSAGPVLDGADTVSNTLLLSQDQTSSLIDAASSDVPVTAELADNNFADMVEAPAGRPTTETRIASTAHNLGTTKKLGIEKFASEIASSETTAVNLASMESSVGPVAGDTPGKTDLGVTEVPTPVQSQADISNVRLLDELAKTQILTPSDPNSADLRISNTAIANLRDPAREITIRAVAASWVEIVRDNGEEVMAKLMQAGDSYVVEGNTRLYLSTGNAGGLMVVIGFDDPVSMGGIGEIVRDLPLVTEKLRKVL